LSKKAWQERCIDPPYGIKYASNFQPRIDKRESDLLHKTNKLLLSFLIYLKEDWKKSKNFPLGRDISIGKELDCKR